MNKGVNIDIFHHLRDAVTTKRPKKWRTNSSFLLHNNSPAHWLVMVKDFLPENNVTTLEQPPYPPGLAPADVYLFLQLKSALKGQCIVMLLTLLRMQDRAEKSFIKWLPGMFPTPLQSLAEGCSCIRGLF
jgi:hypothetical protein